MNTHYLTLILRLRLDDGPPPEEAPGKVAGSLQQVGMQHIRYFDSVVKLQQALQQLVDQGNLATQPDKDGS